MNLKYLDVCGMQIAGPHLQKLISYIQYKAQKPAL
jgi:hypothetical protein